MTDAAIADETSTSILHIKVIKGKDKVDIDANAVPAHKYKEVVELGFQTAINGGMTKVTKANYADPVELAAKAMEIARDRVEKLLAGTLTIGRKTATKGPSGVVMTEARRIAKQMAKDIMRDRGFKLSHYPQSVITELANAMIEDDPSIIQLAEHNIANRKSKKVSIDIGELLKGKEDENLVEKALVKKAKGPISAKQAGKVQPRAMH